MKTKIILLIAIAVVMFSFTLIKSGKSNSQAGKNSTETRATKGLAMEDRNQFN